MKITGGIAAGAALAFLLAGCAQPQALQVMPEVQVADSELGRGRALQVSVADKRPTRSIGSPGYEAGPDLAVQGDLAAIVRSALASGLARLGFNPSPAPTADARELRVELLNLDYGVVERSALSRHVEGASRLKALCLRGTAPRLERSYRGDLRRSVFLSAHDAASNSRHVSAVVSEPINALLADRDMLQCLAQ